MKKIYVKEWMLFQPYERQDEVDTYYVNVANHIAGCLKDFVGGRYPEHSVHGIAIYLTLWFQDVISQTGIWQAFSEECRKRYGCLVPFMTPEKEKDYYPGEVNPEDLQFLLWHYLQCMEKQAGGVLNPENPAFEELANQIYDYLSEEFQVAPENERLHAMLYGEAFGENDYMRYRSVLEWFHFCSYVGFENRGEYQRVVDTVARMGQNVNPHILSYDVKQNILFEGRKNLLSLTSVEWLALVGKSHPETALWAEVKALPQEMYLYEGEDEKFLFVKDLSKKEGEQLSIRKDSLNMDSLKARKEGVTILSCRLVQYGGAWWQDGMLVVSDLQEKVKEEIEQRIAAREGIKKTFDEFMKASGGKQFVFCKSEEEVQDFLSQKLGYKEKEGIELPKMDATHGLVLMVSPHTGIHVQMQLCECISSPDNTFYDAEAAKKQAAMFILNPNVIPYDLSCALQDADTLPDACLNSALGEEHGRETMKRNARFFTDYFFENVERRIVDYSIIPPPNTVLPR